MVVSIFSIDKKLRNIQVEILKRVIIVIDVYQALLFFQNVYTYMVLVSREKVKPAQELQVYVNFIVILGYGFLTLLLKLTKTKSDMLTLLACLIYALQQMHLFVKVDPLGSVEMQGVFRYESLLQCFTFITMIGPFLPLRYYFPPIAAIYTFSFWITHYQA